MLMKNTCRNILVTGTILIWFVKFWLRAYLHNHGLSNYMLGVFPNLMGSFLVPFGVYFFFNNKDSILGSFINMRSSGSLLQVCILSFCMLVVNEYLQLWPIFGRTFDYADIASSAAGLLLAYRFFLVRLIRPGKA